MVSICTVLVLASQHSSESAHFMLLGTWLLLKKLPRIALHIRELAWQLTKVAHLTLATEVLKR
jgi:hypothetical protein